MNNKILLPALILLAFFSISCGLFDSISQAVSGSGGDSEGSVADLWADVPLMHGLDKSEINLPLPVKIAVQAFIGSLSKNGGSMNYAAFTTSTRTAEDITNFYNPDLMAQSGWNSPNQPGCSLGEEESSQNKGGACFYMKEGADRIGSILAIMVAQDTSTNLTNVFFIRFDGIDFSEMEQDQ
ncbi:MAG: hypothetical protein AB9891_16905 [Anaerolineaceae bacterium]